MRSALARSRRSTSSSSERSRVNGARRRISSRSACAGGEGSRSVVALSLLSDQSCQPCTFSGRKRKRQPAGGGQRKAASSSSVGERVRTLEGGRAAAARR